MPNIDWTNKNTLQNLIDTIHARLITKVPHYAVMPEATVDLLGEICQFIGETDEDFTNAYFYKCVEVEDETTGVISYEWQAVEVQNSTHISAEEDNSIIELEDGIYSKAVQVTALPNATEDNIGVIYQFIGETTEDYTNGYFYANFEVTNPETGTTEYIWKEIKVQSDIEHIDLTMNEYNALPNDKYTDDKVYFITDADVNEKPMIYGFHINPDESDPYECVTYLEDAVGMTPMSMGSTAFNSGSWGNTFIKPRPCMLKSDGTVDYYLDPNDYAKKKDGTPSDIANAAYDGNAMMEFDLIWFKFEAGVAEGEGSFYCSNEQVDDTYDCPCNKDVDGNIIPHFYVAIYNGTGTAKLRSLSGVTLDSTSGCGGTTGTEEITRAIANNTTDKIEWYVAPWCDEVLINALHVLVSHSLDSQSSFGRGLVVNTGGAEVQKTVKESYVTGSLNKKGLFWGDTSSETSGVKTFGMENRWGCCWRRAMGINSTTTGFEYKMTQPYSATGEGYTDAGFTRASSSGFVSKMQFGDFGFLPLSTSGSSGTTYYTDSFHNGNAGSGAIACGGALSDQNNGIFNFDINGTIDSVHWSLSTILSCKPLASRFEGGI